MQASPILIIGKNGKTGLRVEQRLRALGHATRGVSRATTPAFDWQQPDTWRAAMQGARSAYVTFYPDLAVPSAEQAIADFVALAGEVGLDHLVLLSGRGEPGAERAEAMLMNSGLDWNVVRSSWFMQNFSEGFLVEGILAGTLALPAGDVVEPFVDIDDVADVAVAALTRPELRGRLFQVSGPRALSFARCAEEISAAVGYPVAFQRIDMEDFLAGMRQRGLPEEMTWLMRELFTVVLDGRNARPVHGIEEALGRPATDFADYLRKVVASGAWHRSGLLQRA